MICALYTEWTKTGGRSSGSVMQTETESANENGRRNVGRKRRNASGDRMKTGGEGKNGRMERTHAGSGRRRLKKKKSVPWKRKRVKTVENSLTLRGRRSLPKTTRRRRVVKESGYEIR